MPIPRRPRLAAPRLVVLSLTLAASTAHATDYYLDSVGGSDANTGRSATSAWRSVAPLRPLRFNPGDHIYFARGSSFDTTNPSGSAAWDPGIWTQATSAGTATDPITFTAYGTGAAPILHNTRDSTGASAMTLRGSYVVIDGLELNYTRAGSIVIEDTATHVTVTNCEFHHVGAGVTAYGAYATITHNYFHDGTIIVNTPGGTDDYGANGVVIAGPNIEVAYNRAERLITPCYDFGVDGGFVELYGAMSDVSIHHNTVSNSDGFIEGGSGTSTDVITRLTIAYNLAIDNTSFTVFHNGGDGFAAMFSAVTIANNTIVETMGTPTMFWSSTAPGAGAYNVINNIVSTPGGRVFLRPGGVTHTNNIFPPTAMAGVTLDATERAVDPRFVGGGDYHLAMGSPAIDTGTTAPYASDLDGVAVPSGAGVDIGAYEHVVAGSDAGVRVDAGADSSTATDSGSDVVAMTDSGSGGDVSVDDGVAMLDASSDVSRDAGGVVTDASTRDGASDGGTGMNPGSCGCSTPGRSPVGVRFAASALAIVALVAGRRRTARV